MWINGGPGCSSALGLFMELGPCSVKDDPKNWNDTEWNPYSWNNNANVFFLDEPISVGFSHAKHGQTVGTTEEAAKDVQAFVAMFFDAFKEFEGRDFHMAGESYGGRYLPVFASAVVDGNKALKASGRTPINLKSVMIGNGGTEYQTLSESYYTFQCTLHGGLNETVQSIQKCVELASAVPKCHKYLQKNCIDSHDYTECGMAALYCDEALGDSFVSAGVNPYDVSKPCTPQELGESLCYSVTDKIKTYLDLPDVHDILGVTSHKGWNSCNGGVGTAFALTLDFLTPTTVFHVRGLLERGIRFLNYAGTYDFICNHIANEMWVSAMDWTGKEGFAAVSWQDWEVEGKKAGLFKTYENLTLLKIVGAGHMVPYDKPKEALTMLSSWLQAGL
ncbi:cathepsin A (carboxypeptidase C) [Tremella mesenterica]|uniref:Carboxypeptidase n=1 Tax=Tremella mesenterica TaxID=5217 RepID=A0A4V1M3K6_TREME|nr:cathepsin A (carboxypeptidase C) [Tremella mesenterica]